MNVINAKNPIWTDAEHTLIKLDVLFEHLQAEGYVPFNASASDMYEHTVSLYNKAVAGEFGVIGEYIPEPVIGEIPVTNTEQ